MKKLVLRPVAALFGLSLWLLGSNVNAVPVELLEVIDTTPTGDELVYMALSPDGTRLYAVRRELIQGPPTEVVGELVVIDTLASNSIDTTIALTPGAPFQPAFTPDGQFLLLAVSKSAGSFISSGENRVDVFDATLEQFAYSVPIMGDPAEGPTGIAVTPAGDEAYVSIRGGNRVQVLDLLSQPFGLGPSVPTDGEPVGIAATPDGTRVYVVNRRSPASIDVIATDDKSVTNLPIDPDLIPNTASTTSIAIAPDGSKAYATFFGASINRILVIDTDPLSPDYHTFDVIPTSFGSLREVSFTADGEQALVASQTSLPSPNQGSSPLLVIDALLDVELGSVIVGGSPFDVETQSLSVAYAYVSTEDVVDVIGLSGLPVEIDIKPGSDPNCFNPLTPGVITVAIFGSDELDVDDIDRSR